MPIALIRLRALALDLLALVWPTACAGCGAPDREWCQGCRDRVRAAPGPLRRELGVPCFVRDLYEGPMRAVLVAFKNGGRTGFAGELGAHLRLPLAAALELCAGTSAGIGAPVLVPVPSRPARVRERGYRHVDVLLRVALRGMRDPSAPDGRGRPRVLPIAALRTTRGRRGQVGLGPAERARNARHVAVRPSARRVLRGREAIILDDVVTTGATALAARDALESAGARVVAIVALCGAERRDTRRGEQMWRAPPWVE